MPYFVSFVFCRFLFLVTVPVASKSPQMLTAFCTTFLFVSFLCNSLLHSICTELASSEKLLCSPSTACFYPYIYSAIDTHLTFDIFLEPGSQAAFICTQV
jgi:hypothetical protein